MQMTNPRRSSRSRKSRTLRNDQVAWTEDTLRLLRAESDSSDRSSVSSTPKPVQKHADVDFEEEVAAHNAEVTPMREDDGSSDGEESSSVDTLNEHTPPRKSVSSTIAPNPVVGNKRKRLLGARPKTREWAKAKGLRSRMFQEGSENLRAAKEKVYADNYGPDLDDLYPILRSRDIWHLNMRDTVFPSRASMEEAIALEVNGAYLRLPEDIEQTRAIPTDHQKLRSISLQEADKQKYLEHNICNEIVIGSSEQSQMHMLQLLQPYDVNQVSHSQASPSIDTPSVLRPPELLPTSTTSEARHRGSFINLGATPQHLAWAPGTINTQYLAVLFTSTQAQRNAAPPRSSKLAPAFSPSPAYPSSIQIWRVDPISATSLKAAQLSHDPSAGPRLHQQLCTSWGSLLRFEWLSLPPDTSNASTTRFAAVLSSDGKTRIISIDLAIQGVFEILHPALKIAPPPNVIFTSFTAPNFEDLIVSDSGGAVHLYSLHPLSIDGTLLPYATIQVHNTYITSLICATDSPHFIVTQTAAGAVCLTDLRSPNQDRVYVHKSRLPSRNLSYLPHTRTFITTADAAGNSESSGSSMSTVVSHSLRYFYQSPVLLKLPENSGVTTVLACSTFHPVILVANAKGEVYASNVLKRLLPVVGPRSGDDRGSAWYAKVVEPQWIEMPESGKKKSQESEAGPFTGTASADHEVVTQSSESAQYRRSTDEISDIDLFAGRPTRPGRSRFHFGFKPQRVELGNLKSAGGRKKAKYNDDEEDKEDDPEEEGSDETRNVHTRPKVAPLAASTQVLFPEEQAVTAMAWNPNGRFAGWCAIAWGSGIAWITDLSHDVE